jgi:hypothetical protein
MMTTNTAIRDLTFFVFSQHLDEVAAAFDAKTLPDRR